MNVDNLTMVPGGTVSKELLADAETKIKRQMLFYEQTNIAKMWGSYSGVAFKSLGAGLISETDKMKFASAAKLAADVLAKAVISDFTSSLAKATALNGGQRWNVSPMLPVPPVHRPVYVIVNNVTINIQLVTDDQ